MNTLAFGFGSFGTMDMVIIMGIALLLFGKRLPEVGKSLGKGIVEFKKGLKSVDDDVTGAGEATPYRRDLPPPERDYRAPLPPVDDRRVPYDARAERTDEFRQPQAGEYRTQQPPAQDYRQAPPQDYRGEEYRQQPRDPNVGRDPRDPRDPYETRER